MGTSAESADYIDHPPIGQQNSPDFRCLYAAGKGQAKRFCG
jgi:hypothetical protein